MESADTTLGRPRDDAEATRIVYTALDYGVTFLDNCWDYNDGKSEERMGGALADGSRRPKLRTAKAAPDGRYEQFKTTVRFDGNTAHPKWLESAQI